mgnify:CR=1 FL=1
MVLSLRRHRPAHPQGYFTLVIVLQKPPQTRTLSRLRRLNLFLPGFLSHRYFAMLLVAGNGVFINFRRLKFA